MFLARREFGKVARVYPVSAVMNEKVFTFTPMTGDGWEMPRRASTLAEPGICAIADSRKRALDLIHENEEAALEDLL